MFRVCAIILEALIGFIFLLLVLCGFLFWRLVEGPVSLDFLTPILVEDFDARNAADSKARITGTRLFWDDKRQSLELQVTGLTVDNGQSTRSFVLPLASIDFSFGRLLEGRVEVTNVEMVGARLTVRRNADQGFEVLLFQPPQAAPTPSPGVDPDWTGGVERPVLSSGSLDGEAALSAINALLSKDALGPLADLGTLSLTLSQIVVDDRVLGFHWTIPAERIVLRRTLAGLGGELDVGLPFGKVRTKASLAFSYNSADRTLDIAGQIDDLDMAALTKLLPQVDGLTVLDSILNGDISATLGGAGRVFFVDFELKAGAGFLRPAKDVMPPIPITGGAINGRIDLAEAALSIYDARVATGTAEDPGPEIAATLRLAPQIGQDWWLEMTAQASQFPVQQLSWLWPSVFGTNAHAWVVENITKGQVDSLAAAVSFRLTEAGAAYRSLSGHFNFSDLTLHYLRPMPPMAALTGTTKVEGDTMLFEVKSGQSEGLDLGPGTVRIYDLSETLPRMQIDMPAIGKVADMLAVLDKPRLALMSKAGIDWRGAEGRGEVQVSMGFPILDDLTEKDIDLSVTGRFQDAVMPRAVLGQEIAARRLTLAGTIDHLTLKGDAEVAGSAVAVDYLQKFDGSLFLKGSGRAIEAKSLIALIPALNGSVEGRVAGDFDIEGNPGRHLTIAAKADLQNAGITLPNANWRKHPGTPGRVSGEVVLERGELSRIDRLDLDAKGLRLIGSIGLREGTKLDRASFSTAKFREFDLTALRLTQQPNLLSVDVAGPGVIDARGWIAADSAPAGKDDRKLEAADAPGRVEVILRAPQTVLLPVGEVRQVTGSIDKGGENLFLNLTGQLYQGGGPKGQLSVAVQPEGPGRRGAISVANLGALLRALNSIDYVRGGALIWRGRTAPGAPKGALKGPIDIGPFRLTEIPSGLQVITVAGLTGIKDALEGPGVSFDRLSGDLAIADDRFTSKQLRAIGSALGILVSGQVDVSDDRIDIEGKVVPAYAINRLLDSIPVFGWVITGGENQGLFAVSYDVEGSLKDPRVTINPLSALAPPILRSFVELLADGNGGAGGGTIKEPERSLR
ncbi:MAG: AsmA-like C-terminal domain-containing protein [Rhodospirillales bacterium]|nr:AsmA-like C-terminal domain-containing protein [Rhodospirillales bacterium]